MLLFNFLEILTKFKLYFLQRFQNKMLQIIQSVLIQAPILAYTAHQFKGMPTRQIFSEFKFIELLKI